MKDFADKLRAAFVEMIDAVIPKRGLKLFLDKRFQAFLGSDRLEALNHWFDNNFMLKRRQRRCEQQPILDDTREYLKTRFCANPFLQLETTHTGLAYVCCPVWLPTPIGPLRAPDARGLWNSEAAQRIRESILDGSFRYCNHLHCPAISGRTLPARSAPESQALIRRFEAGAVSLPEHLILSHDKSCNLSCPSCRATTYNAGSRKQAQLDDLTEATLAPLMRQAKSVKITGSGDAFGSKHFRNLIKRLNDGSFPGLKIDLLTNGQLLDRRAWADLCLAGRVRELEISIDATTSDTYAIVRRGGRFERLLENLEFVKHLRASGEVAHLSISMVVQALNFREMPDFVRLGERIGADLIIFNMIRQRDIFARDEFKEAFIGDPAHEDYAAFCEVLDAPELAQPNVQIGNVRDYVKRVEHAMAG